MLVNSILLTLLPGLAIAANDWSKPCTSGTCSYESGDGKNTAWSNLVINAESTDALSDITPASGWDIINCDPKSIDPQDIRLVCVDPAKGCSQLFNGGAENTIIRLPEDCGGGPFARVAKTWVDKDQSLPARLAKRGQTNGKVRGLSLDFDFSKITESRGKVYITAAATNSPAQRDAIRPVAVKRSLQPTRHANRRAQATSRDFTSAPIKRNPFSIGDIFDTVKNGVGNAVSTVLDRAGQVVDTVKDGEGIGSIIDSGTGAVPEFVDSVANGKESDININLGVNAFSKTINCLQGDLEVALNVDVTAQLKKTIEPIIVNGTIVPFSIQKLAFNVGLTGDVSATFNVVANAKGSLQTPNLTVFETSLSGLEIPGIVTVRPTFSIKANALADLVTTANISVTASISLPELQFTFPASGGNNSHQVAHQVEWKDTPINLDVGALDTVTGRVEAHLIPRLDLGVAILNGQARGTVFANLDASARLGFTLEASASGTPVDGDPNVAHSEPSGGSIAMDRFVEINVGTQSALRSLFDPSDNFQLFNKTFPFTSKTFGGQARKRSVLTLDDRGLSKRALNCSSTGEGTTRLTFNGTLEDTT